MTTSSHTRSPRPARRAPARALRLAALALPALLAVLAALAAPPLAAQEEAEEEPFFAVELASASRAATLDARLAEARDAGAEARVERREGLYRLLVGRWSEEEPARRALERWRERFASAVLYASPGAERAAEPRETVDEERSAQPGVEVRREGQENVAVPEQAAIDAEVRERRRAEAAERSSAEEARLWALAGEQRWAEVRAGIDALRRDDPEWTPPARLLELLAAAESAERADAALAAGRWRELVALAAERPGEFSCRRIDLLWGLAEAHARTGSPERALGVYRRALGCDREHVVPTLAKAAATLEPAGLAEIHRLAKERVPAAQSAELEGLRYAYYAGRAGSASQDGRAADVLAALEPIADAVAERRDAGLAEVAGWSHRELEQRDAARLWFGRALEWEEGRESAAYGLALTLAEAEELEALAELAARFPDSERVQGAGARTLTERARAAFDAGDHLAVVSLLERRRLRRLEDEQPLDREQELLLAWSLYHLGSDESARDLFAELYAEAPDAASWEGLVRALERLGDREALLPLLDSPPEGAAADADTLVALAWSLAGGGEPARAAELFARALELDPELEDAAYGLALARLEADDREAASAALEDARKRFEDSPRLAELAARIELAEAEEAFAAGDLEATLERLRRAEAGGRLALGHRLLKAWALFELERFAEAALTFEQVYRERPDETAARGLLLSLAREERWRAVEPLALELERAIEARWPELPSGSTPGEEAGLLTVLGWSAHRRGESERAATWFGRALELDPGLDDARHGLALVRFDAGDLAAAEAAARGDLEHPAMRELLAGVLAARAREAYEAGEHERSLALLDESAALRPLDDAAQVLRGWNLYRLGDHDAATAILEAFYQGAPPGPPAASEPPAREPAARARSSAPPLAPVRREPGAREMPSPPEGEARVRATPGGTPGGEQRAGPPIPGRSSPGDQPSDRAHRVPETSPPPAAPPAAGVAAPRPSPPILPESAPSAAPALGGAGEASPGAIASALGWSLLEQGQVENAESWLRRALDHDPTLETAAVGLAEALWRQQRYAAAEALAARFPGSTPMRRYATGALAERALEAYRAGRWAESLELLAELEHSRPLDAGERLRRAWSLYYLGRYAEAAPELERLYRDEAGPGPGAGRGAPPASSRPHGSPPSAALPDASLPGAARLGAPAIDDSSPAALGAAPPPAAAWAPVERLPRRAAEPPARPGEPASGLDSPFPDAPRAARSRPAPRARAGAPGREAATGLDDLVFTAPPRAVEAAAEAWAPGAGPALDDERVEAALVLGWSAYEQQRWERAASWFGRALALRPDLAPAAQGLILARLEQGQTWEAEQLARRHAGAPAVDQLLGRVLAARGEELFAAEDFRGALDAFDEAALYRPLERSQQLLRAWALHRQGRFGRSARAFDSLVREQPDAASVEGLFYSHKDAGRVPELEALAAEIPGPPGEWLERQLATLYAQRKLWLASERARPGAFAELEGVAGPRLAAGWVTHDKSGVPGLGELRLDRLPFALGRAVWDEVIELELRVDRLRLDAGELLPGAEVGSLPATPAPFPVPPATRLDDAFEPHLALRREGWLSPYLELSTTPGNAAIESRLTGRLGFVQQRPRGNWLAELYARPVQESLLAYGGLVDPYTGDAWGRVVREGGMVGGYRQWSERWGSYVELGAERLVGEGVADNERSFLGLSVVATAKPRGLDYLIVGPYARFEAYDRNLERFTRGHGGYFSPDDMLEAGLAAELATAEGRDWWLRARVSLGYHEHTKARAPYFPLAPDGRFYPREEVSGSALAVELRGVRRLGESLQLGAGLALNDSPRYDYYSGQLYLAWLPQGRPTVLGTDLLRRVAAFP